jgi:uncharacterized protein with ParB-like and HNH nuclease domain
MNWKEITTEITKQLKGEERNLSTNRRLLALDAVEKLIPEVYKNNPSFLIQIGKDGLKKELHVKRNLSPTESEAINNIYSVLNSEPIPVKKSKAK